MKNKKPTLVFYWLIQTLFIVGCSMNSLNLSESEAEKIVKSCLEKFPEQEIFSVHIGEHTMDKNGEAFNACKELTDSRLMTFERAGLNYDNKQKYKIGFTKKAENILQKNQKALFLIF